VADRENQEEQRGLQRTREVGQREGLLSPFLMALVKSSSRAAGLQRRGCFPVRLSCLVLVWHWTRGPETFASQLSSVLTAESAIPDEVQSLPLHRRGGS